MKTPNIDLSVCKPGDIFIDENGHEYVYTSCQYPNTGYVNECYFAISQSNYEFYAFLRNGKYYGIFPNTVCEIVKVISQHTT